MLSLMNTFSVAMYVCGWLFACRDGWCECVCVCVCVCVLGVGGHLELFRKSIVLHV